MTNYKLFILLSYLSYGAVLLTGVIPLHFVPAFLMVVVVGLFLYASYQEDMFFSARIVYHTIVLCIISLAYLFIMSILHYGFP